MKAKLPITTTLAEIREHQPCENGWKELLRYLGKTKADNEPLLLLTILDSNGFDDCLWSLRTRPDLNWLWRLYIVSCARNVQHLMNDQRSIDALDVAERYALGTASCGELAEARSAAWSAAWAAPREARPAAEAAAEAVAEEAAEEIKWDVAWHVARAKNVRMLRRMLETGERPDWKEAGDE